MLARDVMTTKPEFISPTATLKDAAKLMRSHDYGFIPIGEEDRLIGAVTDRDLAVRAMAEGWDPNSKTVREVMTENIQFCYESDSILKVAQIMEKAQIRRLVVLNKDKRMTGIISLGDIAVKCKNPALCNEITAVVAHH